MKGNTVPICLSVFGVILALLAPGIKHIWTRHWHYNKHNIDMSYENWRTNATWIRKNIPTKYYKFGELDDVMEKGGWLYDQIQLYRLDEGEVPYDPVPFLKTFNNKESTAFIDPVCDRYWGSIFSYCPGDCVNRNAELDTDITPAQALFEEHETDVYQSRSHNNEWLELVYRAFPSLPLDIHNPSFFQGITSVFRKKFLAAILHASPTASMAFQVYGTKDWILFDPETYDSDNGFKAAPTNLIVYPQQAPKTPKIEYYNWRSRPGDILIFPPNAAHAIVQQSGPSVLVSIRAVNFEVIWKNMGVALHSIWNKIFFPNGERTNPKDYIEHQYLRMEARKEVLIKGCGDDHPTNVDVIITKKLMELNDMHDPNTPLDVPSMF